MRYVLSYIFYFLGDLVSKPMVGFDMGFINGWLYVIYNKLMTISSAIQKDGNGPWENIQ